MLMHYDPACQRRTVQSLNWEFCAWMLLKVTWMYCAYWRGKSFWFKVHLLVDQRRLCAASFFHLEAFDLLNDRTALLPSTINCHVNRNMKSVWCLISISIYKINKWSWCGFHVMFAEGRLSSLVLLEPAALKYWCLSEVSGKWSRPWSL